MNKEELKAYFIDWRKDRLGKLAKQVKREFRKHPERHEALHALACEINPYPIQEYASWLCGHLVETLYPSEFPDRQKEVIDAFLTTENPSVKRNLLKIVLELPTDHRDGDLLDHAFYALGSPNEAIAVRSYSFRYLLKLLPEYPDLQVEIDAIIREKPELFQTGALLSCIKSYKKLLKKLKI